MFAAIRVKVPLEVALAILAVLAIIWLMVGVGALARQLERHASSRVARTVFALLALGCLIGAGVIAMSYYTEQDQYDPSYRGLEKFGLGEVVLSAGLAGFACLCLSWIHAPRLGAFIALGSGIALIIKPIAIPLMSLGKYGSGQPFGLFSETHLYFLLSGAALLILALMLATRR